MRHLRNPDFDITRQAILSERARMLSAPVGLARPLVVIGGWRAPSWSARVLAQRLGALVGGAPDDALGTGFPLAGSMDSAMRTVRRAIERKWGSVPREVDVVAVSMGGLVARALAVEEARRRREEGDQENGGIWIRRLFTLGTPHRGARGAALVRPDAACRDMRAGSGFLRGLDACPCGSPASGVAELVCYARLRDDMVGARNSAPRGVEPIWKDGPVILSHELIALDREIITDVARRLRGEAPLAGPGSAPPRM
jgi:pimeloyl-ACP methyl ester carboxylesterase